MSKHAKFNGSKILISEVIGINATAQMWLSNQCVSEITFNFELEQGMKHFCANSEETAFRHWRVMV